MRMHITDVGVVERLFRWPNVGQSSQEVRVIVLLILRDLVKVWLPAVRHLNDHVSAQRRVKWQFLESTIDQIGPCRDERPA